MKKQILTTCLIIIVKIIFGQDIIVKRNGDEIKAKVTEVNTTEILFNLPDSINGTVFILKKSDVFMIKYENGKKQVFNEADSEPTKPEIT